MKNLPQNLKFYKATPEFTEETIPKGLLRAHSTKAGVWGKIVIFSGELEYRIHARGSNEEEVIRLNEERYGVVEPTVLHEVKAVGPVRFRVEFNRIEVDEDQ